MAPEQFAQREARAILAKLAEIKWVPTFSDPECTATLDDIRENMDRLYWLRRTFWVPLTEKDISAACDGLGWRAYLTKLTLRGMVADDADNAAPSLIAEASNGT